MTTRKVAHPITITSGSTVSNAVPIGNARQLMLSAPVLTACSLMVLGSLNQSASNFVRLGNPSTDTQPPAWAAGTGSAAVATDQFVAGALFLKLESTAAQASARTFTLVTGV
jgi:hypothetical protein